MLGLTRKFPLVRQADESDCGAACLASIALHFGRPVGLHQVRGLSGTDRAGTNLLGLIEGAQRLGFSARAGKGPYEALLQVPLPAIVHVKTEEGLYHFIVLYKVDATKVLVGDPARGVETLTREQFAAKWTGYVVLLAPEPGKSPEVTGGAGPWRRFVSMLAAHTPLLAEAFVCAILLSVLGLASSYFIQHLVDSVLVRSETGLLNALGTGMILVLVFKTLFSLLENYLLAHVGRQVDLSLIARYARHVLRQPMAFFEMRRVGEILSRVHDAEKVREAISGTTLTAVVDATLVVVMVGVLWAYDVPLAAVATLFIPLLVGSVMLHHPAATRLSRQEMENSAALQAHLNEDVAGVEAIKAFGAEETRAAEGEQRLVRFLRTVFGLQKIGLSMNALGTVAVGAASLAVLWYGGHRVIDGALTIGQLMFFSSLLGFLLGPLERLASVNVKLQEALVAVDRLFQVLDLPEEALGDPKRARMGPLTQGVALEGVCFRYGCRANVLEQVDLNIPAGTTVGIVGESGSGKSTLLKLLMGFYSPTAGRLLIDGVDIRDLDLATVRARVGLVAQDPFVFTGTLRENIALAAPDATLEDVIAAARAAGLEDFIAELPDRYDTVIGERGANLSGGQRQRLAIARALVRKPDLLIFDEATSHLDTATERAIQESLKTVLAGRTAVVVAHRLSTVKDADVIYVLEKGQVAEAGTHAELLAAEGLYAALWRAQIGEAGPALPAALAHRVVVPPTGSDSIRHVQAEENGHAH